MEQKVVLVDVNTSPICLNAQNETMVGDEIAMHFLSTFTPSLDFMSFVPIEANS